MKRSAPSASKRTYADLVFNRALGDVDEIAKELADLEQARQNNKLIMIASEALCPKPVREALSSTFTNLYAEGYPRTRMIVDERCALEDIDRQVVLHRRYQDRRYYKGCDYVNLVESIAQKRVAELFATKNVPADHIHVNVQPHSGASANNAIYEAFLKMGDTVMGMSLASGGHLTHGSPVNRSGKHYNIVSYTADLDKGKLDYEQIRRLALQCKPKMIIGGYSAYPWDVDWKKFRGIADEVGDCVVLADVSHTAGLISAGVMSNPIEHAHVVMFTTQKTMCGPRGAVILTTDPEVARKIDSAVFPGEQSGAHFNNILAKAVCFEIAKTPEFKEMQRRIVRNARALGDELKRLGLDIAYGGTESHMVLVNLRKMQLGGYVLTGETASRVLDLCGITCNKNEIAGDENAVHPSAVRFGTTWVTQRGLREEHMVRLARVIHSVLTGIIPFDYIGGAKNTARGKVKFDVIEKARLEVCKLVNEMKSEGEEVELSYPHYCAVHPPGDRKTPLYAKFKELGATFAKNDGWTLAKEVAGRKKELKAVKEGALILDTSDIPAIEVIGDRSTDFLQESLTRNIYSLDVHDGVNALMLDPEGRVMASLDVFRLEDTEACGPRYILTSETTLPDTVREWLYGLSDGYVRFDPDVFMKVEGPVLVEDLLKTQKSWASIDIVGPRARQLCENVVGRLPRKEGAWARDVEVAGGNARLLKLNENGGADRFRLSGPFDVVSKALDRLLSVKGKAAPLAGGVITRDAISPLASIPDGRKGELAGAKVLRRKPDLVDLNKPYFVGADALETEEEIHRPVVPKVKPPEVPAKSFLLEEHHRLFPNASIHLFAGWEMPVVFDSIRSEHEVVRMAAGVFDLSHMGVLEISGPYSSRFLDLVTTNYVRALRPGQSHYSHILDPTGDVLDDVFVYRLEKERYLLVANAVNAGKVEEWLNMVNNGKVPLNVGGRNITLEGKARIGNLKDPEEGSGMRMIIAVQGPKSRQILSQAVHEKSMQLWRMRKFEIGKFTIEGASCFVSRTGYTGEEFGYEVFVHPEKAADVWNLFLTLGAKPAGLGARDSTRTEAGLPLWGNELAGPDNITPIEAGYGAFVKLHKPFFIGRDAMVREALNRTRDVVRFKIERKGARLSRRGDLVATKNCIIIGSVTSSVMAGTVQIGLALVERGRVREGGEMLVCLSHTASEADIEAARKNGKLSESIPSETAAVLPRFPPRINGTTIWQRSAPSAVRMQAPEVRT